MKLKVDCSFDKVTKYIESEVLVDGVSVLKNDEKTAVASPITTLSVNCGCIKFVEKAIKICKLLGKASNKKMYFVGRFVTISGRKVYLCVLHRDKSSDFLFEMLTKLGIYTNDLTIGINPDTYSLYTTNKLLRELSRIAEEGRRMLTMYLYTLTHFLMNITADEYNILDGSFTYESFADTIIMSESFLKNFPNTIFSFAKESLEINIEEIPTEDITSIKMYKTLYSYPSFKYPKPYECRMSLIKTMSNHYCYILYEGDVDISPFTLIDMTDFKIYTNRNMCYIDLDCSFITALLQTFEFEYEIQYIDDMQTFLETYFVDKQIKLLGSPEDVEDDLIKTYLTRICKGSNYPSYAMMNITDYDSKDTKRLITEYKLVIEKDKSVMDAEDVKVLYKDDEYAQKLYEQVQNYYADFNLGNLGQYLKGFAKPNDTPNGDAIYAMIFTGESGTGKSTAARVIPYRCGIPYVSVNFSVNIEESDLFGTMIPNPNKSSSEDAEFIWQDGVITRAVRNGYCVILEELNFARPGVLGKLNSLLDETRQIDLQTGEIVKAHPYFKIIATCNISYEGTNSFNKALINRFEQCIEFNEMTSKELLAVIKSRTGYTDTTKIEKILVVYEALKKYSIEQNVNVVVSVRQLLTLFRQGKYCKDARDAVVNILINGAFIEEPEYKEEFLKAVLSSIDLSFKL